MQKIMIVSDTHKRLGNLMEALYREEHIDKLIHLGDIEGDEDVVADMAGCEVLLVPGNNDYYVKYNKEIETQIGKYNVLLTHGHYYYVSLDVQTIREEGIARGMDIVMFGHTHRPLISIEDDITLINPGSLSYPRQADGKPTYIIMLVQDDGGVSFSLKTL